MVIKTRISVPFVSSLFLSHFLWYALNLDVDVVPSQFQESFSKASVSEGRRRFRSEERKHLDDQGFHNCKEIAVSSI